ncbi:unnamed protein product [Arabidopsis lyrata]|nr:unnamed protein product [Arabidopsis lyrata]
MKSSHIALICIVILSLFSLHECVGKEVREIEGLISSQKASEACVPGPCHALSSSSSSSSSSSGRPSVKIEEIEGGAAGSGVVIGSEELETNPKTVVASIADETVGDGIPQPIVVDLEESKNGVCADESIDGVDLQYIPPTQIVMLILGTRGDVPPLVA